VGSRFDQVIRYSGHPNAHGLFRILDEHLWFREQQSNAWICFATHPAIADIACFPYILLSEEGGISRQDYPAIRRWSDRVKRLPGFVVMPGIFQAGPAQVK
jgi:glutathione S-transferase